MRKWRRLAEYVVLAAHEEQLAEHGGRAGVRDLNLLRSALARPQNKEAYGKNADAATLAAAYAFGLCRDHPFIDGNKRAGLLAAEAFLIDNGFELIADDANVLTAMLDLANGSSTEESFATWLRKNITAI